MTMTYFEHMADLTALDGVTVGVVGYGNPGRALALNLRDSGVQVLVSAADVRQYRQAEADGVSLVETAALAQQSRVIYLLVADEVMTNIYMGSVSPHLRRGHSLVFASGYNVTYGYIEPPPFVDVGLLSPRVNGDVVRAAYQDGDGFHSFIAVAQDASRQAWPTMLALAHAAGALVGGATEIVFEQEAELSLFIQQGILPFFYRLMQTATTMLMSKGYPAEVAVSDLYMAGKFNAYLDKAMDMGLFNALIDGAAQEQYATLSRLGRFNDLQLERMLEVTLDEIRGGAFAKEWARETLDGYPRLQKLVKAQQDLDLWDWEQQTLDLLRRDALLEDPLTDE